MKFCIHPLYPWNPTIHQDPAIILWLSPFWLAIGDAILKDFSLIKGHVQQLKVYVFLEFTASFERGKTKSGRLQEASPLSLFSKILTATYQGLSVFMISK